MRGGQPNPHNVRNSVLSLAGKLRQSKTKRDTKLRYVVIHVACLLIVFCRRRLAMPSSRHENVRHATLLSRRECLRAINRRGRRRQKLCLGLTERQWVIRPMSKKVGSNVASARVGAASGDMTRESVASTTNCRPRLNRER